MTEARTDLPPATVGDQQDYLPGEIAQKLVNPDTWADDGSVNELFRWIRTHQPLAKAKAEGFEEFWVVSKHADVKEISRQNDLFHSGDKSPILMPEAMFKKLVEGEGAADGEGAHHGIVYMDPPDHFQYRLMTQSWLAPGSVKRRDERIRTIAGKTVERMGLLGGRCDFVSDLAVHYPLEVIMEVLGVPEEHYPTVLRYSQEVFSTADEDLGREDAEESFSIGGNDVFADFNEFFRPFHEEARRNPKDDLLSVIAGSTVNGEPIRDLEAFSYYVTIATAGHDTTSSTAATGMWALATKPSLLARLKAHPEEIPAFVDEAIRWTTPVHHFMRTATDEYELRGRKIRRGDWLMLAYPSANRDEEVFDAPDEFRADRSPNHQIAFGFGGHLCLGQHLARLELRILFEELLPHLDAVKLAGPMTHTKAVFVGGPKSLPIEYVFRG